MQTHRLFKLMKWFAGNCVLLIHFGKTIILSFSSGIFYNSWNSNNVATWRSRLSYMLNTKALIPLNVLLLWNIVWSMCIVGLLLNWREAHTLSKQSLDSMISAVYPPNFGQVHNVLSSCTLSGTFCECRESGGTYQAI